MIYFVRHGEASASWGQHPDPGLSDNGWIQAEAVATRLLNLGLSHAVSSPMARCQETAGVFIEQSGLTLSVDPRVTEIPTPADIDDRVPWLRGIMSGEWSAAPELVNAWRNQLIEAVSALPDQTVVFSHFIAINALVGSVTGSDMVTVFRPNYCSLTVFDNSTAALKLVERGESLDTRVL